jgi:uncharacterized membrane protein YeiB
MDFDDRSDTSRQFNMSMEQTLTAPLNNTVDFLVIIIINKPKFIMLFSFLQGIGNDLGQTTVSYEQILDEPSRECKLFIVNSIRLSFLSVFSHNY